MDERSDDTRTGAAAGGGGDHGGGVEEPPTGPDAAGDGSRANGGHRSPGVSRVRWLGVATAIGTVVLVLAQLSGDITGNSKSVERIERTVPKTLDGLKQLNKAVSDVEDAVQDMPTPRVTVIPGPPGKPGKPGPVVTVPPKTVVITTPGPPGPTKTIRPRPVPTCRTSLLGACLAP